MEAARSAMPLLAGACAIAALCLLAIYAAKALDADGLKDGTPAARKVLARTIAEGVGISRHGLYGVELVRCGSCRVEKRKKGPLTFGGLNVLVLDDLSVVVPPKGGGHGPEAESGGGPREMAGRLGVSDGFLSAHGVPLKFSGLHIAGLSVSRLADGDRPELVLSATTADAVRGGLDLHGCTVHRPGGVALQVGKARAFWSGGDLRVRWDGGEMDLSSGR